MRPQADFIARDVVAFEFTGLPYFRPVVLAAALATVNDVLLEPP